jgi:hypothetical protein
VFFSGLFLITFFLTTKKGFWTPMSYHKKVEDKSARRGRGWGFAATIPRWVFRNPIPPK